MIIKPKPKKPKNHYKKQVAPTTRRFRAIKKYIAWLKTYTLICSLWDKACDVETRIKATIEKWLCQPEYAVVFQALRGGMRSVRGLELEAQVDILFCRIEQLEEDLDGTEKAAAI